MIDDIITSEAPINVLIVGISSQIKYPKIIAKTKAKYFKGVTKETSEYLYDWPNHKFATPPKMPTKDNTFGEDMTAIDLINLGKKTSTTRRLAGEVGDFITFKEDTKKATYQITDIIEIKDVWENKYGKTEVGKEGKSIPLDLWSKEEGWSKDYLKKKFETVWKADIEAGKPIAIHRFKKLERTDKRKKKQ